MRCYFLRDNHIAAFEELDASIDADAICQADVLKESHYGHFLKYEI